MRTLGIRVFIAVTFIFGLLLQAFYMADKNSSWLLLAMWAPTVGVLAMGKNGIAVLKDLKKIKPKWIIFAIGTVFATFVLNQFLIWVFGLGAWNENFILGQNGLFITEIKKADLVLGNQPQSLWLFIPNILISLSIGGVIATFIGALGEEIGWRGFLQPTIAKKYGWVAGTFIVGLFWAYWHIPANLGGINGKENILLVTFVTFPLAVIFMSFTLAWIRYKSDAIWPCAVFHGFNNAFSGFFLYTPYTESYKNIADILTNVLVGSVFLILFLRENRKRVSI